MPETSGHIELERRVESIVIGARHRELGDLRPLIASIERVGLLQPVTITPEGVLVCGRRRLEAVKRLGWTNLRVWVRTGLSDELTALLAQQDENATHKPLSPHEAVDLYRELKRVMAEDAARRQRATRFGASKDAEGRGGGPESGPPSLGPGKTTRQAALMVTGSASHARLEQLCEMERIAADRAVRADIRGLAGDELQRIRNGGPVDPGYQRVSAALRVAALQTPSEVDEDFDTLRDEALELADADRARRIKENRAKRASAAANAKRSVRSFGLMWAELDGWSKHYDPAEIAREVRDDDWALFLRVLDETRAFADSVTLSRGSLNT